MILRSRVLPGCVSSLRILVGDSPWNYNDNVALRVNRVMLVNLCAETIKPVLLGGQNLTAVEGNASVYEVYPVSRITGEERAEFLRALGHGFEQEGEREGGGGWAGQLKTCVETINP